jgi:hypothetical protein
MINKVILPKQFTTYSQPSTTSFITSQDQPIIQSHTSWSSPYGQSTTVNTVEQPQQQYGQLPNQPFQPQFTFVPQQQKLRSFARVFQPELNTNGNIQSAYRR